MARNASRPTSIDESSPRLQIPSASSRSPALVINSRRPDPAPCANRPVRSGNRTRSASAITASGVISVTVLPRHLLRHLRGLTAEPHLGQVREAFEFSGPAFRWLRARVSAIYLLVINIGGIGLGATVASAISDHIFADETRIGDGVSWVAFVSAPVAGLLFWRCQKTFRALQQV